MAKIYPELREWLRS